MLVLTACEENPKEAVRYIDENNNGFENYAVAEIIVNKCANSGCHIGTTPTGNISMDTYSSLMKGVNNNPGFFEGEVVIPFSADKSLLYQMMQKNVTPLLPHDGLNLTTSEINIIKDWINDGAKDNNGTVASSNAILPRLCMQSIK